MLAHYNPMTCVGCDAVVFSLDVQIRRCVASGFQHTSVGRVSYDTMVKFKTPGDYNAKVMCCALA
jgi:hypothetical protein